MGELGGEGEPGELRSGGPVGVGGGLQEQREHQQGDLETCIWLPSSKSILLVSVGDLVASASTPENGKRDIFTDEYFEWNYHEHEQ